MYPLWGLPAWALVSPFVRKKKNPVTLFKNNPVSVQGVSDFFCLFVWVLELLGILVMHAFEVLTTSEDVLFTEPCYFVLEFTGQCVSLEVSNDAFLLELPPESCDVPFFG